MKLKLPLVAAFVAILGLSACGGSSNGSSSSTGSTATKAPDPGNLAIIEDVLGTGTVAAAGKTATVKYTGWLYSDTSLDHKGTQFDTGTFSYTVGSPTVVAGFDQGVTGMKAGGKRTVYVPSSLGYGSAGNAKVPPNTGMVFEIELTQVQ